MSHAKILEGVVVTLSGYTNPTRAELRDAALALGGGCPPRLALTPWAGLDFLLTA
jgi:hypothetical protein